MEEQAWLVRARSDSEGSAAGFGAMAYSEGRAQGGSSGDDPTAMAALGGAAAAPDQLGSPDQRDADCGELIADGDAAQLDQFHEDALRQAGCGWSTVRAVGACCLAMAGGALELAAPPFVLRSAELELCIRPHQESWLVLISLVGLSLGPMGWGWLAARAGRRRALLACLAVNAVFAAIAAFMPTYGTFMMARFCSAIGSGGIIPTSFPYAAEVTSRGCRARALSALVVAGGVGALAAALLAAAVLPQTGEATLIENKEHFSAWHRYLILCAVPLAAALAALIGAPESPRFLLAAGREVDAMRIYQKLHSGNQVSVCGAGGGGAAAARGPCELALPAKRRPHRHVTHTIKMFWQSFFQLFSHTHRNTTLCYGGIMVCTMAIQFFLSSFVPASLAATEARQYAASRRRQANDTYRLAVFNRTLENVDYAMVEFDRCVFRDMLMLHARFRNCSFLNVQFLNVRTSYTTFEGCTFINNTMVDADITPGAELDPWCVVRGTTARGMLAACPTRPDLAYQLGPLQQQQIYVTQAVILAGLLAWLPEKTRPLTGLCALLALLSPTIWLLRGRALVASEAAYRLLTTLIFLRIASGVIDTYAVNLRCMALGLILSVMFAGGALARGFGVAAVPSPVAAAVTALLATAAAAIAFRVR